MCSPKFLMEFHRRGLSICFIKLFINTRAFLPLRTWRAGGICAPFFVWVVVRPAYFGNTSCSAGLKRFCSLKRPFPSLRVPKPQAFRENSGRPKGARGIFLKKIFRRKGFCARFLARELCLRLPSKKPPPAEYFSGASPGFLQRTFLSVPQCARFAIVRSLQVRTFCKFVRIVSLPGSQIAEELF